MDDATARSIRHSDKVWSGAVKKNALPIIMTIDSVTLKMIFAVELNTFFPCSNKVMI